MLAGDARQLQGDAAPARKAGPGVVVIGRNEGERLRRCLASVAPASHLVVYVDSGSTDGSVTLAESQGVVVVKLDMTVPFTAARARNAGVRCLRAVAPHITLVQFIDGDCEIVDSWIGAAASFRASRTRPSIASPGWRA